MFYKNERLLVLIDGANLFSCTRSLGFDLDYRLLRSEFAKRGNLIRIVYYTTLIENDNFSPVRPLVDWLDYNGYSVRSKLTREYIDSAGRRRAKGDMNIEIAIDALELADRVDHIVLFSGDRDFTALVAALQLKGVRVSVVSSLKSEPPMISDELRRQSDNFIDISDLRDLIVRDNNEEN